MQLNDERNKICRDLFLKNRPVSQLNIVLIDDDKDHWNGGTKPLRTFGLTPSQFETIDDVLHADRNSLSDSNHGDVNIDGINIYEKSHMSSRHSRLRTYPRNQTKQKCVTKSSTEAELVAVTDMVGDGILLKN